MCETNILSPNWKFKSCIPKSPTRTRNKSQNSNYSSQKSWNSLAIEVINYDEDDDVFTSEHCLLQAGEFSKPKKWKIYYNYLKTLIFILIWIAFTFTLILKKEYVQEKNQIVIPCQNVSKGYTITKNVYNKPIKLTLEGAFDSPSNNWLKIWIEIIFLKENQTFDEELKNVNVTHLKKVTDVWKIGLSNEDNIEIADIVKQQKIFYVDYNLIDNKSINSVLQIKFQTNLERNLPLVVEYNPHNFSVENGIIYAGLILFFLYFLIIFEIIHRTMAAILASTISIAVLGLLDERPAMNDIISWIDIDTLLLLTSMMIIVAIFSDTGIFDYMSVMAFKVTKGKVWPLINLLCFFTALLSCFLDNVTTALLMTPITIRLCEVMKLNPIPILITMVVFSNIGGAITPIGDPPNVIIASNPDIMKAGVNFLTFTLHMGTGVLLAMVFVYIQLRFTYRDLKILCAEPSQVQDLKREIAVWQKTAASLSSYSKDESTVRNSLMKRITILNGKLNNQITNKTNSVDNYNINLCELIEQYPIRDKILLIKSSVALLFVIFVFFFQSIPDLCHLGIGWTAILGAILLLLLSEQNNIESILARVEWSTLIFFAALFVLMEALSRLGLIDCIGKQTEFVIMSVKQENRLLVAILLIMWVSAIASAFVDNIPLTTMMVRIVTSLADNDELNLPMQPLVWALSFGACLGGNGTLFGSSSNIVCAGVAEQHGYRFSFMDFFKIGFPVMILSMVIVNVYLLVAHVFLQWH